MRTTGSEDTNSSAIYCTAFCLEGVSGADKVMRKTCREPSSFCISISSTSGTQKNFCINGELIA